MSCLPYGIMFTLHVCVTVKQHNVIVASGIRLLKIAI